MYVILLMRWTYERRLRILYLFIMRDIKCILINIIIKTDPHKGVFKQKFNKTGAKRNLHNEINLKGSGE